MKINKTKIELYECKFCSMKPMEKLQNYSIRSFSIWFDQLNNEEKRSFFFLINRTDWKNLLSSSTIFFNYQQRFIKSLLNLNLLRKDKILTKVTSGHRTNLIHQCILILSSWASIRFSTTQNNQSCTHWLSQKGKSSIEIKLYIETMTLSQQPTS